MSKPIKLENGVWVIDTDTHYRHWCAGENRLLHEPWYLEILSGLVSAEDVVIDGGANIGCFTYIFQKLGCEVHSFEPNPTAFECLMLNCPGSNFYNVGLAEEDGATSMTLCENAGASFFDPSGNVPVQTRSLDSFRFPFVSFLKLDVEGMEYAALCGAIETIKRCKPGMFIEINDNALHRQGTGPDEIFELLKDLGYRWQIAQPDCTETDLQYDIICEPR